MDECVDLCVVFFYKYFFFTSSLGIFFLHLQASGLRGQMLAK